MKRDLSVIRSILHKMENRGTDPLDLFSGNYTYEYLSYQVERMQEGGLLADVSYAPAGSTGVRVTAGHLTWEGHEWADLLRDDRVFAKVQARLRTTAVEPTSFAVLKRVAEDWSYAVISDPRALR